MNPQAPEIRIPSEPLKCGWPVNSRMAEDLKPVADLLEFDRRTDGTLESRFAPNTKFYPLRVRTIAQGVKTKWLNLGILGDDTAINQALMPPMKENTRCEGGEENYPERINREIEILWKAYDGNRYLDPDAKVFSFRNLPAVKVELLKRQETPDTEIQEFLAQQRNGRLLAPYPRLSRKILFRNRPIDGTTVIEPSNGQTEFMLRAMPKRYIAAVDIVRSGETAKRYGLASVGTLLESRPGLWGALYWDERDEKVKDVSSALRERLKQLIESSIRKDTYDFMEGEP